jgi:hypothetical protein
LEGENEYDTNPVIKLKILRITFSQDCFGTFNYIETQWSNNNNYFIVKDRLVSWKKFSQPIGLDTHTQTHTHTHIQRLQNRGEGISTSQLIPIGFQCWTSMMKYSMLNQ